MVVVVCLSFMIIALGVVKGVEGMTSYDYPQLSLTVYGRKILAYGRFC